MDLSPDEENFPGRLLHQAALWDNVELLQELLSSGADVDARDAYRRSALHAAALAERSRCLAALCAAGAQLDAQSDPATGGKSALHIAAERGHVENVGTLLAAGAELGVLDASGHTALALAERAHHRHAARALRDARDALERERLSQHACLRELVIRGDTHQLKTKLSALGASAGLAANLAPAGANTLLYVASEAGLTSAVAALLDAGADGRAHPVTQYSPLYAACYHGHADTAKLLLKHFPEAVQQETVEKWLPLHAACIGGHAAVVTLLLEHPYPSALLASYTDESGLWRYYSALDMNARDARGHSALYAASALGDLAVVDALLQHFVRAVPPESETPAPPAAAPAPSPHRAGISLGIHAIVSKLTGAAKTESSEAEQRVRPVRLALPCGGDSCVAAAARAGHARVVRRLLEAGAAADAPARAPLDHQTNEPRDRRRSRSASAAPRAATPSPSVIPVRDDHEGGWTALAVAVRSKNIPIAELLLQHGATDTHCRALAECARHGLADLLAAILATKAYPDPDYKLNKSSVSETVFSAREGDSALTYSALCPNTPAMLHWRELRCQLACIRMSWVRSAVLRVNAKLSSGKGALHALTRVDVANNELRVLPPELFTLISLRYLNAAQNKLERLPSLSDPFEDEVDSKGRRIKKNSRKNRPDVYSAPVLQELYLQDNRLEDLPPELFSLPALTSLDVSNNKLRRLPGSMWAAPQLRDLSAALNHLRDLPTGSEDQPEGSPSQLLSPSESSPQLSASSSSADSQFVFISPSKSSSRSPSIERSESDALDDQDDAILLGNRAGNAVWSEAHRVHAWRGAVASTTPVPSSGSCPLQSLNLSHNQLSCVPPPLACRAPNLTRLNLAYNSLRSMSYVTSYPTSLRQLDLSHNEITCWPSLPQVENFGSSEGDPLTCYCPNPSGVLGRARARSGGSVRAQLLHAACPARRHLRLEALRTLILANNLLTRIQLTTDGDGFDSQPHDGSTNDEDDEWGQGSNVKGRLLFPLLSMLDVSCNLLRNVPPAIHELSNLAVLNISGNKDITDLPPQMGLLSRLWNLNTVGCTLQEPLRSMLTGGRYKSMDIVGYLLSVLQEAKPYARCKLMLVGLQGIGKTSLLECLRQESAIQHRRKATDHWARRMGNKSSRRNMSTVGVDIGAWTYEKQRSNRGPVTFRTWDFGGQHEYYATHQYFLSRRSLYLVVWKVTDGRKGLVGALNWLRSIQARAPGSPVIMVATHYDQVVNSNLPESESPEALQRLIRSSIMGAPDADKLGLPRVLDSVEVSCSTRHNIRLLADIIYSVAFSVKPPGSKESLLEQRIPATYLALEECVTALAAELEEPVLRHEEYKRLVTQYMQQKNLRMFRDAAELHQATMFLHENGVLLHYDDATLKELYFLRPQWLCDVLAHVVTVREINPFANNGIMKVEDLAHVFKASPLLARGGGRGEEAGALLNKFELALCWGGRLLLLPPLLPRAEPHAPQVFYYMCSMYCKQLPVRSREWSGSARGTPRRAWPSALAPFADPARGTDSPTLIQESSSAITVTGRDGGHALRRLLLLSYVPCGLWPRLCTRVLADAALASAAPKLYRAPSEMELDETVTKALDLNWGWKVWRTGLKLVCGDLTLVSLRELPARRDPVLGAGGDGEEHELYGNLRLRVRTEGAWGEMDLSASACIELLLPAQVCVVRRQGDAPIAGYQSISLEPNPDTLAQALALVSEHVDLLLEDWYPSLGTRFVHTSEGRCLITRLVPCPACLKDAQNHPPRPDHQLSQALRRLELGCVAAGAAGAGDAREARPRLSQDSRASDGDSGVGAESNASSRLGSVEGVMGGGPSAALAHGWTVEECILAACSSTNLHCPRHADVRLRDVAPDTLLLDVEAPLRARWEHITRRSVAGRGAFGTVLSATWRPPGAAEPVSVALKALQPVPPPNAHDPVALQSYKAAVSRWERDPTAAACRAYCALRQELTILSQLRHPHIVPLVAACAAPLALLLALAPLGALDGVLRAYRGCGARVGERAARALALQVARALEYLHARRIVYRDLKSENVLVWAMPEASAAVAAERSAADINVHVKLADYGISRLTPPSGTKGFGGTEGFMAPEIMRYNGEQEYNEKVDCFSYGMLLYELLTLRQPFEGHEAVKEAVLDGARPALSPRDLQSPCCVLDSMRRCWSGAPELRPSAAALVCVAAAPEYCALQDACAARLTACAAAAPLRATTEDGTGGWEIWYGGEPERAHTLIATPAAFTHQHTLRIPPDKSEPVTVTAMCRVGPHMWLGDSAGRINVYTISKCALSWSVRVQDAVGGAASPVAALLPLPGLPRVALALQCGRLFLVSATRPEAQAGAEAETEADNSFVLTELGAAADLCCLAAVSTPHGLELWAGGDGLYAYRLDGGGVRGADALPAAPRVALLAAAHSEPYVFAYCDPGVCVYQWCVRTRRQAARLDCSKLVPCSESLQSIAIDERLGEERCKVTALCALRGLLYAGTAWGCVVVADAASLRPLTVCRVYEGAVAAMVPLAPLRGGGGAGGGMLATVGEGYRPLLQRFAPAQASGSSTQHSGFYCLLWRTQRWLPD